MTWLLFFNAILSTKNNLNRMSNIVNLLFINYCDWTWRLFTHGSNLSEIICPGLYMMYVLVFILEELTTSIKIQQSYYTNKTTHYLHSNISRFKSILIANYLSPIVLYFRACLIICMQIFCMQMCAVNFCFCINSEYTITLLYVHCTGVNLACLLSLLY